MQFPTHLKPEQRLLRVIYVSTLTTTGAIEDFSVWCITGIAAILGLLVANINSVSNIISKSGLKWGIALLTVSMLAGALAKQLGFAIRCGVALLEALYTEIASPEGTAALEGVTDSPEEFQRHMTEPFLWPIKGIMIRAAKRGAKDPVLGEKRFVRMLCIQIYASYVQIVCAASGLLFLGFGIK